MLLIPNALATCDITHTNHFSLWYGMVYTYNSQSGHWLGSTRNTETTPKTWYLEHY